MKILQTVISYYPIKDAKNYVSLSIYFKNDEIIIVISKDGFEYSTKNETLKLCNEIVSLFSYKKFKFVYMNKDSLMFLQKFSYDDNMVDTVSSIDRTLTQEDLEKLLS